MSEWKTNFYIFLAIYKKYKISRKKKQVGGYK